jgi:ferredoxin
LVEAALSNLSERPLAGLTIKIDRDLCVGFGDCIDVTPDVFEFDEEGIAVFKEGNPDVDREVLLESCSSCPVDALLALDEEGNQLAP